MIARMAPRTDFSGGKAAGAQGLRVFLKLRPFQERFLAAAFRADVHTAALSLPRGNGKSALAAHIVARVLDPDDVLFRAGTESVVAAASLEQGRIVYRFAREVLEPRGGYRWLDSGTRIAIVHRATNTRLRVIGSNAKGAMGLVGCPWVVADEPGAWEVNGGTLMFDAIQTAQGKPGSPLKAVYIGTLAPSLGGWWHDLVAGGSRGSRYVQALQGDRARWRDWREIRRVNPLTAISPDFCAKLREERDEARRDSRLKARFLSYRLNVPTADEATMLLTVDDWKTVLARPLGARDGRPIVGIDLGGGRAWHSAVAVWRTGRIEAIAVAPGIPSIEAQERRDRVPRGTYARLVADGSLRVADGVRVQPPGQLVGAVTDEWGAPARIVCDYFRLGELRDVVNGVRIVPRRARWSEASEDIRGARKLALDGPLSCAPSSRALVTASLAAAVVRNDDQGSVRLVKKGTNSEGRDDVAAALVLAGGALARELAKPAPAFPAYAIV